MTDPSKKSTRDQIVANLGRDLKSISDRYDELNRVVTESYRDDLKREVIAGREVTDDQLRLAKTTRHDLEMEIKLDKIQEDPEKYYREARKKALAEEWREEREALIRPFKKLLDWILRRG